MATIKRKNFPGVYTQINDESFTTTNTSRFRPGLIGVASKGPMSVPTQVKSIQEFVRIFGQPIADTFLGTALGVVAPYTDGSIVVRIGAQYQELPIQNDPNGATPNATYYANGTAGDYFFDTIAAPLLDPANNPPNNTVYVEIRESGKRSLINANVTSVSGTIVNIDKPVPDRFFNGNIKVAYAEGAASKAEGVLDGYTYSAVSTVGDVIGYKGNYYFTVSQNPGDIAVGDLISLTQSGSYPTQEVYVSKVNPLVDGAAIIEIKNSDDTERGYQALPLQANYIAGAAVKKAGAKTTAALIYASTEGTWANTTGSNPTTGLQVKVSPGTQAGTKRLSIYWDSILVESYDNLGFNSAGAISGGYGSSVALDFEDTINTDYPSNYITIVMADGVTVPANSSSQWNLAPTAPLPVPYINAATGAYGGTFSEGNNGADAQASDYVGQLNPVDDTMTGLKCFEDTDNILITHLCAPGVTSPDGTMLPVHTQLRDTAYATKSIGYIDVPDAFNGVPMNIWSAIDWHNGQGQFQSRGKLDTAYLACYWNWFTMNDPITQISTHMPPTIGALQRTAYSWFHDQPWSAAAGEIRGVIDGATAVDFERVSDSAKESMYGSGNSINPILKRNGIIMIYGERTMQRRESKLTAIHNLVLVEYVVQGLANIGRRHVFDPNDQTLLGQINGESKQFLDTVQGLRGIEAYNLVCDTSNNNADSRNRREVIVDLYIIPTDVVERIYINATVRESGAEINNITG